MSRNSSSGDGPRRGPGAWARLREQGLRALVAVLAVAVLLGGLIAAGRLLRDRLRPLDRYTVPVGEIDCPAPPGLARADFLAEVQYLARLPDRVELLDDELPARLTGAFAHHPWVEKVEGVQVGPGRVSVRLVLRTPVLAVPLPAGARCVDGSGVLLPVVPRESADGLPQLTNPVPPPVTLAGQAWDNPAVQAAAATAARIHPFRESVRVKSVEVSPGDVVRLELADGRRVVWGRPPGQELPDEPPAAKKVQRLHAAATEAADRAVIDLQSDRPGR